jgi:predicted negative regulator of RcsB-dependent stress response
MKRYNVHTGAEEDTVDAKTKITRKQLKQPDEFVSWGARALRYAVAHIKYIVLGSLLLVAIIAALVLWRQHETTSEELAYTRLAQGIALFHDEQRREESLTVFSQLIAEHPRTRAATVALLYRGRCYFLKKDIAPAIQDFKNALNKTSSKVLRGIALNALGNALWMQKDYRLAMDYFQQIIASGDEWFTPYAYLQVGMCWEKLGDSKKAAAAFQEAIKYELPPPWDFLAKTQLSKLKGK